MNESKTQAQSGPGSLQREAQSSSGEEEAVRKKIKAVREGHHTGGYCETETLQAAEKELHKILTSRSARLEAEKPGGWQEQCAAIAKELRSFCYRPKLVVAQD